MNLTEIDKKIKACFDEIEKTKSSKRKNDLFKCLNKLRKERLKLIKL